MVKPRSKPPHDLFADYREHILQQPRAELSSVARVRRPTVEEFRETYAKTGTPVVITGAMDDWPVMQWAAADIDSKIGHYVVKTMESGDIVGGQTARKVQPGHALADDEMRLSDYLRETMASRKGESPYAANVEIHESFEDVLPFPAFFPRACYARPRFWFARAGVRSAVHWDQADNLHGVVWGKKTFRVAMPSADPPAQLVECTLERGDLLYLPTRWWHGGTNEAPTFAVNFFASRMVPFAIPQTGGTLLSIAELARRLYEAPAKSLSSVDALHAHMRLFFSKLSDNDLSMKLGKISAGEAALVETDIVLWALRFMPWRGRGLVARLLSAGS